jgi:hypothetical protein
VQKGFKVPKEINMGLAFSMRQPSKNLKDLKINNDVAPLCLYIRIFEKFDEALNHFKKNFKAMRTSLDPFGQLYAFRLALTMPFTLPRFNIDLISDKYTLILSNLNAQKVPFCWDGHKSQGAFFFVPNIFKIGFGMSLITVGDRIGMGVFGDETGCKYPQEFVNNFRDTLKDILANPSKYGLDPVEKQQ